MHKVLMEARERFLNIYANLPLKLRNEIVLVLEGEPLTWNAAKKRSWKYVPRSRISGTEISETAACVFKA